MRKSIHSVGRRAALLLAASSCLAAAEPLRLQQVLSAAIKKAEMEEAGAAAALGQVHLLESLRRMKIELRPQAGAFSFSEPRLLAASTGASLVLSRRSTGSTALLENSRLDALAAQVRAQRARLDAEIEGGRRFFDLLEKQQIADRSCQAVLDKRKRGPELAKLIQVAKLTAVDRIQYEEQVLDSQSECLQANTQRKLSALRLASVLGMTDGFGELRLEDVDLPLLRFERALPPSDRLLDLALDFRSEPKLIREEMAALQKGAISASPLRPEVFSIGYSHVKESRRGLIGAGNTLILGGNTVRAELSWNIPLRNTGEHDAAREIVAAKLKALEAELTAMKEEIRLEVETAHIVAAAGMEKLNLARKKTELSNEVKKMTLTRFQNGLGSQSGLFAAEQQDLSAQSSYTRAVYERKASIFILLALSGLYDQPEAEQERLLQTQVNVTRGEN